MSPDSTNSSRDAGRKKFLANSLESTRKSYYPQLVEQLRRARQNERQLKLIVDNMPARLSYIDNRERFVFVSDSYKKFHGLETEEIVDRPVKDIIGPENYGRQGAHLKQAISGERVLFETVYETRDGEKKWLDISYVPDFDEQGNVRGIFSMSLDRTEKKRMEQEKRSLEVRLLQAQKMEAIGTLAGGIAHDFNNILSGIFGYTQLAEIHLKSPEKAKEYIHKIFEGAERAGLLIQQILTFSRHTEYNRKQLNIAVTLKEALKMLRSTIPSTIEIQENISTQARVLADPTQIHQVILNLCTNAYHAMADQGGVLTVGLCETDIGEGFCLDRPDLKPGRHVRLEVSDTGPGIEPKMQQRIFDPYFTTKELGKGTGLGLAVVDGIIKKHRGIIRLESEPGKGARFLIYLPAIEADHDAETDHYVQADFSAGNERIMLVDDEADIRETLVNLFEHKGYRVSAYENGQLALDEFKRSPHRYDLVITDMTMPIMTGDLLARKLLQIRPDIPIVLCTGYHERFTEDAAREAGIRAYVEKPVSGMELAGIIRDIFDSVG